MTLAIAVAALVLSLLTISFLVAAALLIRRTVNQHRDLLSMFGALGGATSAVHPTDPVDVQEGPVPAADPGGEPQQPAPPSTVPAAWEGR